MDYKKYFDDISREDLFNLCYASKTELDEIYNDPDDEARTNAFLNALMSFKEEFTCLVCDEVTDRESLAPIWRYIVTYMGMDADPFTLIFKNLEVATWFNDKT